MSGIGRRLRTVKARLLRKPCPCLHYFRPAAGQNFGDELSLHITQAMLDRSGTDPTRLTRCDDPCSYRTRLLAVGSILHLSRPGDIVWGSGINGKVSVSGYAFDRVDFRAVRGPLTRDFVTAHGGRCPPVYGDPALLLPRLYPAIAEAAAEPKQYPLSYLPNLNDSASAGPTDPSHDGQPVHTLSPRDPWRQVAEQIARSSFIAASSLHGIILADALGIPCRPILSLFEAPFKYRDYLLSTGRSNQPFAADLAEAVALGPLPPPEIDLKPLIAAFPAELFP